MNAKNQANSLNHSRKKKLLLFFAAVFFSKISIYFLLINVYICQMSFFSDHFAYIIKVWMDHGPTICIPINIVSLIHLHKSCTPVNMFLSCYCFGASIFFCNNSIIQNNNITHLYWFPLMFWQLSICLSLFSMDYENFNKV